MTNEEAIKIINVAILEIEWSYPMEYTEAFDKAIEALNVLEKVDALKSTIEEREKAINTFKEYAQGGHTVMLLEGSLKAYDEVKRIMGWEE